MTWQTSGSLSAVSCLSHPPPTLHGLQEASSTTYTLSHHTPRPRTAYIARGVSMSRSPSPVSSLDFFESDGSASEDEYRPSAHKRAVNKRRPAAVAAPSGSGQKKGLTIKLNLSAAARHGAAMHPTDGDVDMDDEVEEQVASVMGGRVVDLSNRDLKKDHSSRPLWVDEQGQMYVLLIVPVNNSRREAGLIIVSASSRHLHHGRRQLKTFSSP